MVRLAAINRQVRRWRRVTIPVGMLLVAGVVALNAHAALPDHHDHPGESPICIASLSIAVAVAGAWFLRRKPCLLAARLAPLSTLLSLPLHSVRVTSRPLAAARAGPLLASTVLRR